MWRLYVKLFSMNVKVFCILCLCIVLCDTSKASENLTFILKQSHSVKCFCHHLYLLCWREEDQRVNRTNCIRLISKLRCSCGTKWSFWCRDSFEMTMPFTRSRHERFQCVGAVIMRGKIKLVQHVRVSPAECLSRNFTCVSEEEEYEVTHSRTQFKEYHKVFKNA